MKHGRVTKRDKKNKTIYKKLAMIHLESCAVVAIFLNYSQFGAIRKPGSGQIVCKTYLFINSNLLFTKAGNRTKKSLTQLSDYCLSKGTIIAKKALP